MKNLQQFCGAAVLTLALTLSVLGGEIGTPGITAPPPPPSQQSSVTGDMSTPGASVTGEIPFPGMAALNPVADAALSLLQSILSIF
jgi:hypothetical protein